MQPARDFHDRIFERDLQRTGDIVVPLLERPAAPARRAEPFFEAQRRDCILPLAFQADDLLEFVQVARLTIGRQCHHLVLIARTQEAEVVGHRFIEQAQRVRHVDLAEDLEFAAFGGAVAGGRLLAAAVERHHRAAIEGRGQKRAGRVGQVVLDEVPLVRPVGAHAAKSFAEMMRRAVGQLPRRVDDRRQEQWIPSCFPLAGRRVLTGLERHGDRRGRRMYSEQQIRIVGIGHVFDIGQPNTGFAQTIIDRVKRQLPCRKRHRAFAVLDVRESLFFGRGQHDAIFDQTGGRIVVSRVDA